MAELSVLPQGQSGQSSHSDGGAGGGLDDADFRELVTRQKEEISQTRETAQRALSQLEAVKGESQKAQQQIDAMKRALMGEEAEGDAPNPMDSRMGDIDAQMDHLLEAAIQAERAGRPISLTTNIGIGALKFQKEVLPLLDQYKTQIADLQKEIKKLSNPSTQIDNFAYSNFDNQIMTALDTIYGPEDNDVKDLQFETVARLVQKEVKELQQDEPEKWDRIRRDRNAQMKLVNYFVKKTIPPKARQLMEEDHIRRTPMDTQELANAWREAKADPKQKEIAEKIRLELVTRMFEKSAGKSGRFRGNDLYGEE